MSEAFRELGEAIDDERFIDVDLALRRGRHIDRDDADWYSYLLDARAVLEPFYQRYACELVYRSDGYFFLLPIGDKLPKRQLGLPEMIVGQAAALLYLDPATIESGGAVTKDEVLSHLAAVMGTDALVSVFNPKRKRLDERVAQETVRQRVSEGLRKLDQLGFIAFDEDNQLRLRSALMRFADPVRAAGSPREALERLVARGEISFVGPDATEPARVADFATTPDQETDGDETDGDLITDEPESQADPNTDFGFDRQFDDEPDSETDPTFEAPPESEH